MVDVSVNIQIKAKVPYYLENQGLFRNNLSWAATEIIDQLIRDAQDVEVIANEIKIGESVIDAD